MDYTITFDGGAKNNGASDAQGYGSYQIKTRTGREETARLEFDSGTTNNEAEYKSLLSALTDLVYRIWEAGRDPREFTAHVIGDSQLVLYQVNEDDDLPKWKCNHPHLRVHRDKIREYLALFGDFRLEHRGREHIVEVLGH